MVIHVMSYIKGEKTLKLRLAPIIIALFLVQVGSVSASPNPESLSFEIFSDGVVRTEFTVSVDQTAAQVNVTLFGDLKQDLFIYDEEGLPLESTSIEDFIQVNSLGANSLDISYLTPDLTGKNGAIWSIDVETPVSTGIILPLESTIINLNEIPLEIETIDDQTYLTMPSGKITVSYTIDIKDSKELAEDEIILAQTTIEAVKELEFIVTEAEELLAEAVLAFESEDYLSAQEKAYEARNNAGETGNLAAGIMFEIEDWKDRVQEAEDAGRTIGIDEVKALLDEADELFENGEYLEILGVINQIESKLPLVSVPETSNNNYTLIGIGSLILLAGFFIFQRRPKPELQTDEEEIDLERLFSEHPEFRLDDKEALRFMAEHGGEAFAHEIRERLDIPRTSAWRMIQRLQRYEVVEERKIGGQSLISIVDLYRRRKQ